MMGINKWLRPQTINELVFTFNSSQKLIVPQELLDIRTEFIATKGLYISEIKPFQIQKIINFLSILQTNQEQQLKDLISGSKHHFQNGKYIANETFENVPHLGLDSLIKTKSEHKTRIEIEINDWEKKIEELNYAKEDKEYTNQGIGTKLILLNELGVIDLLYNKLNTSWRSQARILGAIMGESPTSIKNHLVQFTHFKNNMRKKGDNPNTSNTYGKSKSILEKEGLEISVTPNPNMLKLLK